MNWNDRWKSMARCCGGILSNLAVVGIGLGIYEGKWWPALVIGTVTGLFAIIIAGMVTHD